MIAHRVLSLWFWLIIFFDLKTWQLHNWAQRGEKKIQNHNTFLDQIFKLVEFSLQWNCVVW